MAANAQTTPPRKLPSHIHTSLHHHHHYRHQHNGSEYYEELHSFHELLPALLKPGHDATYSFFNGFASDNAFFHLVYGR